MAYPDWEKKFNSDTEKMLKKFNVDINIVNLIINACKHYGLSLNQTAVVLANAFLESRFNLRASNNIKGGHHGIWQFSTSLYDAFGLSDWSKQLRYFMEEISSKPKDGKYPNKKMWSAHVGGNGWITEHKKVWDTSDDLNQLSWALGEGWERYGSPLQDTTSRTGLARMFRTWLIDNNYFSGTLKNVSYNPQQSLSSNNNINYNNSYSQNYSDDDLDEQIRKAREENARLTAEWETIKKERELKKINNSLTIETSKDYFSNLRDNYDLADNSYSFLEDDTPFYKNASSRPGSAHIDFSEPFLTYLENIETYQEGGELKNTTYPQFNIKNTENISKSYFIRPKGPFKGLSTTLDYEAIIKKVFSEKVLKNILEETYKALTLLRVGGTLNKKKVITKALKFRSGGSYDFYDEVYNPDKNPTYESKDPIVKGVKWVGKLVGKGAKKYWNLVKLDWNKSKEWNNDAILTWHHPEYEPDYDPYYYEYYENHSTDGDVNIPDVTNEGINNEPNNEPLNNYTPIANEQPTSELSDILLEPQELLNVNLLGLTTQETVTPTKVLRLMGNPVVYDLLLQNRYSYVKSSIDKAFEDKKLPEVFKYIPFVTGVASDFKVGSKSGTWALNLALSKGNGLIIEGSIDERRDFEKATNVAVQLLLNLLNIYKDEKLALATYFDDLNGSSINKAIRRVYGSDVKNKSFDLIATYLPKEIVDNVNKVYNYYLKFKNTQITPQNLKKEAVTINDTINLEQIAKVLNFPVETIRFYNPVFRQDKVVASENYPETIYLPEGYADKFKNQYEDIVNFNSAYYTPRLEVEPGTKTPDKRWSPKIVVDKVYNKKKELEKKEKKDNSKNNQPSLPRYNSLLVLGLNYNNAFSQNEGKDLRNTPERRQQALTPPVQLQNTRRRRK